jgi:beta-glucosidase
MKKKIVWCALLLVTLSLVSQSQPIPKEKNMFTPLSYVEADKLAEKVLKKMTLDEKLSYVGGDRSFFLRAIPRLGLSDVYMADATAGVHLRTSFRDVDLTPYQLEKSTAFPAPILLASTWNPELAYHYAQSVGEECRAGAVGFLLGPGMNIYRQSQCGRNFEYFGEDPFLAASMIYKYVQGVQSTGTIATLKHFAANNTDFYRRKSNSVVDERTLHEIYLPAFKAGVDAGVKAVMTSYNQINGEWCGQSDYVINNLLRKQLGFKWLVMTDWWSVNDGDKLSKSGMDLEMPFAVALKDVHKQIEAGKVKVEDIDRMTKSVLRAYFSMKLNGRKKESEYLQKYDEHEAIGLKTAEEGIVLLKNDGILPLRSSGGNILITGDFVDNLAKGGGAATVAGYNNRMMIDELKEIFKDDLMFMKNPSIDNIKSASAVLCNIGTYDSEGWDRPFELPEDQEKRVTDCVNNNPNTVVIVTSGSGIRMTGWSDKARAIVYAWYGGQIGNKALAEIITGTVNPSGKLPITIEKEFKDSPAYGYIPEGESLYSGWNGDGEKNHPIYDVQYKEGVFVGYRWYESKKIEPLFNFGHGLSYTTFEYSNISASKDSFKVNDKITISVDIKNSGSIKGMETVQLYVQDEQSSVPRPVKELKGFQKVELEPGQSKTISIELDKKAFSFWNPETKDWYAEKGKFIIHVGSSSNDIRLQKELELL